MYSQAGNHREDSSVSTHLSTSCGEVYLWQGSVCTCPQLWPMFYDSLDCSPTRLLCPWDFSELQDNFLHLWYEHCWTPFRSPQMHLTISTPLLQLQCTLASNSWYLRLLSIILPSDMKKHEKKRYLGGYLLPRSSCLQSSCPLSMINSCEHMKVHLPWLCTGEIWGRTHSRVPMWPQAKATLLQTCLELHFGLPSSFLSSFPHFFPCFCRRISLNHLCKIILNPCQDLLPDNLT